MIKLSSSLFDVISTVSRCVNESLLSKQTFGELHTFHFREIVSFNDTVSSQVYLTVEGLLSTELYVQYIVIPKELFELKSHLAFIEALKRNF